MMGLFFAAMIEGHCYMLQKGAERVEIQKNREWKDGYRIMSFTSPKTFDLVMSKPEKITNFNCEGEE